MTLVGEKWEPTGGRTSPICYGLDHEVTLVHNDVSTTTETFNIIIVRYGLEPDSTPFPSLPSTYQDRVPLARPRHLLPYHQP